MGTTQRMARFITEAKFEDIPTPAVNLAKLCLLDAVGCAVYGTTRPLGKIFTSLVDELGGKPVARVLGTKIETNAVNAAMANGTFGHSEDFDDFTGGHQAVLLMPVVLAMGEEQRSSGKQALLAYIVGFDITLNITHAMGEDHYGRGWHNTSSIGTLGSTAAAAKMLNLDEMQTRMALGIGATQASGLRANFGTMTKPFHPGNACRAGVMAAKMAQKGYEANPDVMEHRFGYAAVYGQEMMHLSDIPRHLGNPWALMGSGKEVANGIAMKVWPCCGGTHGANTAITRLLKKHPIKAEDVASVDIVTTHEPSCMAPNLRWPEVRPAGQVLDLVHGGLVHRRRRQAGSFQLHRRGGRAPGGAGDAEEGEHYPGSRFGRPAASFPRRRSLLGSHRDAEERRAPGRAPGRSLRRPRRHLRLGIQGSGVRQVQDARGRGVEAVAGRCSAERDHEHGAGRGRAEGRRYGHSGALISDAFNSGIPNPR